MQIETTKLILILSKGNVIEIGTCLSHINATWSWSANSCFSQLPGFWGEIVGRGGSRSPVIFLKNHFAYVIWQKDPQGQDFTPAWVSETESLVVFWVTQPHPCPPACWERPMALNFIAGEKRSQPSIQFCLASSFNLRWIFIFELQRARKLTGAVRHLKWKWWLLPGFTEADRLALSSGLADTSLNLAFSWGSGWQTEVLLTWLEISR